MLGLRCVKIDFFFFHCFRSQADFNFFAVNHVPYRHGFVLRMNDY